MTTIGLVSILPGCLKLAGFSIFPRQSLRFWKSLINKRHLLIQYLLTHFIKNDCYVASSLASRIGEAKMELRRPTLADKETILNMMTEFEETVGSTRLLGCWEPWLWGSGQETNLNKEMGRIAWKIAFHQFSSYCLMNQVMLLVLLNLRLRLNEGLLNYAGHIGYSIRPERGGLCQGWFSVKVCK